jgi:hypothetical protein
MKKITGDKPIGVIICTYIYIRKKITRKLLVELLLSQTSKNVMFLILSFVFYNIGGGQNNS